MPKLTPKEQIVHDLLAQFPHLTITDKLSGHVIDVDLENNTAYTRLIDSKGQEYEAELDINIFPQEDFSVSIAFYLILGEIKGQEFVHVNYFYWTPEEIEESKKRAKEMADFFLSGVCLNSFAMRTNVSKGH